MIPHNPAQPANIQYCTCNHPIDEHLERVRGQPLAGECISCECTKFTLKNQSPQFKHGDNPCPDDTAQEFGNASAVRGDVSGSAGIHSLVSNERRQDRGYGMNSDSSQKVGLEGAGDGAERLSRRILAESGESPPRNRDIVESLQAARKGGIKIIRVQRLDETTNEWVDLITGARESLGDALNSRQTGDDGKRVIGPSHAQPSAQLGSSAETIPEKLRRRAEAVPVAGSGKFPVSYAELVKYGEEIAAKTRAAVLDDAGKRIAAIVDDEVRIRTGQHPEKEKHLHRFGNHLKTRINQMLEAGA